ncbi:UPF0147 family protein [Nanoarchaeota archaeon]
MGTVTEIIDIIKDISEDTTVPKNIKSKLSEIAVLLESEEEETPLKVNRALNELDDISSDVNIQPYTRTQLMGIASALESVQ